MQEARHPVELVPKKSIETASGGRDTQTTPFSANRPVAPEKVAPEKASRSLGAWLLRHEKFVRAICMVGAYVFGAIFLVSILAAGVFALVSMALAILFLGSLALFFALWMRTRLRP